MTQNEISKKLKDVNIKLTVLGEKRTASLAFLSNTDIFDKYKKMSNELVMLKADIKLYEEQKETLEKLQKLTDHIGEIGREIEDLQILIDKDVTKQNDSTLNSPFTKMCLYFSEIIKSVIDRNVLFTVSLNKKKHLEFKIGILDDSGKKTSAGLGKTYRKLLCIAFDMALCRVYSSENFSRFIFHDGIFEVLDNRKKIQLLQVIKNYTDYGIQHIITLIDSDLPPITESELVIFNPEEIILRLHDEGENGRLFKCKAW